MFCMHHVQHHGGAQTHINTFPPQSTTGEQLKHTKNNPDNTSTEPTWTVTKSMDQFLTNTYKSFLELYLSQTLEKKSYHKYFFLPQQSPKIQNPGGTDAFMCYCLLPHSTVALHCEPFHPKCKCKHYTYTIAVIFQRGNPQSTGPTGGGQRVLCVCWL